MKTEEERAGIIWTIEDRDIPLEDDTEVVDPEQMKNKTEQEKMEVKHMLRKFWTQAQEEATCAAGTLARLSIVLDEEDYYKVVQMGMRPLIVMEIQQVKKQVEEVKNVQEQRDLGKKCKTLRSRR